MYKVLIAEDEMLVRLGLKSTIDWAKHDMQVIADVPDGQAALEVYYKETPDLVITDLKMPVLGGMNLIKKIREKDHNTQIIILSCLEEFDLVREAMALDVSGYILKLTMTFEEINGVLAKVHEELKRHKSVNMAKPVKELDILREKLLKDFVFYRLYSEDEFEKMKCELKCSFQPEDMILCIMEIGQFQKLKNKLEDERGQLICFTILNLLNEILENYKLGEAIHDSENRYIIIANINVADRGMEVTRCLAEPFHTVESVLMTYFGVTVYFGVSTLNNGFNNMLKMYNECIEALKDRFFSNNNIYRYVNAVHLKISPSTMGKLNDGGKLWDRLGETYTNKLKTEINEITKIENITELTWKQELIRVIQWTVVYLQIYSQDTFRLTQSYSNSILNCENIDESVDILKSYLNVTVKIRLKMRSVSKETADAIDYISKEYHHEISLNEIAEAVNLSPGYVSSLFKKETNRNFIEYLNEFRIEKAKELLLNTSLKSYEISENVGFMDNGYFSRTFKRVTGMRPNEFRKRLIDNWCCGDDNEDV